MAVTTETLQTFLGMTGDAEFDTDRATLLLDLATKIIAPITGSPVPDAADPIMLSCVVRAYLNPTNATNLTAGPYTAAFPSGGVYLTRAERGALQRAIGAGYHFAVEALPAAYLTGSPDADNGDVSGTDGWGL